jgi:hypothetical protein
MGLKAFSEFITFTRSTTGTFIGSNGLIQTAAIDAPRFDYDPATLAPKGLLMEEQRTNLLLYSEQFNNAAWQTTNADMTDGSQQMFGSPDGGISAEQMSGVEEPAGEASCLQTAVASATLGTTYTFSVYLRSPSATDFGSTYTSARIGLGGTAFVTNPYISINFLTGVVATTNGSPVSSSAVSAGNGWFRVTITGTTDVAAGSVAPDIGLAPLSFFDISSGIIIWGAQLEAAPSATSYIPTVASTVTRTRDVAVITGTNFLSWFNASEGTIVSETSIYSTAARNAAAYDINDTTTNNRIIYRTITTEGEDQVVIRTAATTVASFASAAAVTTSPRKAAVSYKANNFILSANGTPAIADTSGAVPVSVTQMQIGFGVGPSESINGHIRNITYYPYSLTDLQLQTLTV